MHIHNRGENDFLHANLGRPARARPAGTSASMVMLAQEYRLNITRVRGASSPELDAVQLSEIQFYSTTGQPLRFAPWNNVHNPGGDNPWNQGPEHLIDGRLLTKW